MAISSKFPRAIVTDYDDGLRSRIQPGDLLLCSGTNPFSRMIRTATGSDWSHVGFVMPLEVIGRVMVLESVETVGVRAVPLSKYLKDYDNNGSPYPGGVAIARHETFPFENATRLRRFAQFAVDRFGYPYDNDEIVRIAARIMTKFLPWARTLKRNKEYICSEYVYECYKSVGVTIPHDRRGFVSPANFAAAPHVKLQAVLKRPN